MPLRFTAADEGKPVVTPSGDVIGRVNRVRDGKAEVDPRGGLLTGFGSWIADSWEEQGPYPLDSRAVAAVEEEAVVLRGGDARAEPTGLRNGS